MKKFVLGSLVLVSMIIAQNTDSFDFRKTRWGMSKKEVLKIEKEKLLSTDDSTVLVFSSEINSLDCGIVYQFAEDKLAKAGYLITEEHTNKNDYINDYDNLKEILIKKYGAPLRSGKVWKNDLYKDSPEDWGFAISIGHLGYTSKWETPRTEINLGLNGDDYKIRLIVYYESKELKSILEKEKDKENLKKF